MKIEEFIKELEKIRSKNGNFTEVIMADGVPVVSPIFSKEYRGGDNVVITDQNMTEALETEQSTTNKDNCDHVWLILREAGPIVSEGRGGEMYPAVFKCQRCSLIMTASEALQLSALKNQKISIDSQVKLANHQLGFEKRRSIIALVISGIALIVSVLALLA